jgi:hypothetical protein
VSKLRYLNPFLIRDAVRRIRELSGGGGPKRLRLVSIGQPQGLLIPTARIELEVEAKNGKKTKFSPDLPVPWPYAWSYRVARKLGVPLVRSYEPEQVGFSVPVPRRSR